MPKFWLFLELRICTDPWFQWDDSTVRTVRTAPGRDFPDAGYFARTFGKMHGMSPTQWRRAGTDPANQSTRSETSSTLTESG
ncbi:MAG: hypothetical protein ACRDRV_06515 [Pseudonocardiaceae bacterium]